MTPVDNDPARRAGLLQREISSGTFFTRSMALPTSRKHELRGVRHQFLGGTMKLLAISVSFPLLPPCEDSQGDPLGAGGRSVLRRTSVVGLQSISGPE
ncbi:hypothetical protein ACFWBG_11280 [Nocardia salmonicida]|uniref:hypothetical protein n=1 Tax=Nocardia salmonicida TaxID=53431 RepID=UPI00366EF277